jgi:hypothetical protein
MLCLDRPGTIGDRPATVAASAHLARQLNTDMDRPTTRVASSVDDCPEAHLAASISRSRSGRCEGEGASAFELRSFRRMDWGDVGQSAPRQNSWLGNFRVLACFQGFRLGSRVAPVGLKGMVTANCRNLEERLYGAVERTRTKGNSVPAID